MPFSVTHSYDRDTLHSGVSSAQKVGGGYFGANINAEEQRLDMYVRSSFTAVNLHDLWSNYYTPVVYLARYRPRA